MLNAHAGLIGLAALALAGCQAGELYVASNTVVGLQANVNTARNSGSFQLGYDRQFVTVIPQSVDLPGNATDTGLSSADQAHEVMAVVGCSDVEVTGIFLTRFVESLATGRAAREYSRQLAKDPASVAVFRCFNTQ